MIEGSTSPRSARGRCDGFPNERSRRGSAVTLILCLTVSLAVSGCGAVAYLRGGVQPDDYFVWPAFGRVSSQFGPRGDSHHDGIDIAAPEGAPVRAAAPGRVVFSGVLRGYGNVVILEHGYGLTTVYAHNKRNLVREGGRVRRGAVIALLGKTGKATGPNLHFEVRREKVARNPVHYLPRRSAVARRESNHEIGG